MLEDYQNKPEGITKSKGFELFLFSCLGIVSLVPGFLFVGLIVSGLIQTLLEK